MTGRTATPADWSVMIDGLITEALRKQEQIRGQRISKAWLGEKVGVGSQTLRQMGSGRDLGKLDFITVALIAEAAGYEIELRGRRL